MGFGSGGFKSSPSNIQGDFQVEVGGSTKPSLFTVSISTAEHVTNGSFADASNWTLGGTGFAIGSNKATYTHPGGGPTTATLTQAKTDLAVAIVPGRMYELSYVVSDNTGFSGQITLVRNDGATTGIPEQAYSDSHLALETANGSHTLRFRADFDPESLQIQIDGAAGTVALSGLSIKECLPNVGVGTETPAALLHVSASSAGRENLFTVSPANAKSGDNTPAFSIVQDEDGDWYTTFGQGPQRSYAMSINLANGGGQSTMQIANGSVLAFVSSFTFGSSGAQCKVIIANPNVPANASAAGTAGEIAWDSGHLYVCVATNTWKRVAIAGGF
tara:strand:- start:4860 stop:5852 length:993 start_codon:yes stop_codon:yes gene_type:complete